MSFEQRRRPGSGASSARTSTSGAPGKRALTDRLAPRQARADVALSTRATEPPPAPSGAPIEPATREHFEAAFGADLSTVRVGEDAAIADSGAIAYAQGETIVARPGALDAGNPAGRELLGHELTHVLQQRAGRVDAAQGKGGFHQDPALEREADELGARAARGEAVQVAGASQAPRDERRARQARLAVAVHTGGAGGVDAVTVDAVDVVGRPEGPRFPLPGGGSTEGDHSTAWGVFRDGLVHRLLGQTLEHAVGALDDLSAEADALPGAADDRVQAMDAARQQHLAAAIAARAAARAQAQAAIDADDVDRATSELQRYAQAYLAHRNAIGLAVLNRGQGATSDGEPGPLAALRHWEAAWTDDNAPSLAEQGAIVRAMGTLFSGLVWADAHQPLLTMPGRLGGEAQADLRQALSDQHLASLRSSYPNLAGRLTAAQVGGIQHGAAWTGDDVPAEAQGAAGASLAVQVVLGNDGRIGEVVMSGRSEHGMGNSEGSHTTAYGLFERAIQRIRGQTLAGAVAVLDALSAEYRAMPGATDARAAEMAPARAELHGGAVDALDQAEADAGNGASVSTVQAYASALLAFRNTMGLVTAHAGNVPGNHNEQAHLQGLDLIEAQLAGGQQVQRLALVTRIGGLFDAGALNAYHDADPDDRADTPGLLPDEEIEGVFPRLVEQHLRSIRAAYPQTFRAIDAAMLREIAAVMRGDFADIDVDGAIALDGGRAAQVAGAPPAVNASRKRRSNARGGGGRRSRRDDDDEWVA